MFGAMASESGFWVDLTCSICLSEICAYIVLPCGHVCVCSSCQGRVDECPICRSPAESLARAYFNGDSRPCPDEPRPDRRHPDGHRQHRHRPHHPLPRPPTDREERAAQGVPDLAAIRPYEHMFEATAWPRQQQQQQQKQQQQRLRGGQQLWTAGPPVSGPPSAGPPRARLQPPPTAGPPLAKPWPPTLWPSAKPGPPTLGQQQQINHQFRGWKREPTFGVVC